MYTCVDKKVTGALTVDDVFHALIKFSLNVMRVKWAANGNFYISKVSRLYIIIS